MPKFLVNEDGGPGTRNDVALAGLLHKMGYRNTTSTVLSFGEKDGAVDYLVGEANKGLAYMFQIRRPPGARRQPYRRSHGARRPARRTPEPIGVALGRDGGTALTVPLDVTSCDSVEVAFQAAEDAFGVVDVVLNNAGTGNGQRAL